MNDAILIPCRCGARIEAKVFAAHQRFCVVKPAAPAARTGDDIEPALTRYETSIMRENFRRGIVPKPAAARTATPTNEYEVRNRARKVEAFINAFYEAARATGADTTTRAVLEEMLKQVKAATPEQWQRVGAHLHMNVPSPESRTLIIAHFETCLRKFEDAQVTLDEVQEAIAEMRRA